MSVGGDVVGVIVLNKAVWVNTKDRAYPHDPPCAIYVKRTPKSECISPGDKLWWQGRKAFWTPYDRHGEHIGDQSDIELERIGYSGVHVPD